MRLIGVLPPDDPFAAGSLDALASLGWEVHAVLTARPGLPPKMNPAIQVHDRRPRSMQSTSLPAKVGAAAMSRIGLAAARSAARVSPIIQAKTGLEIGVPITRPHRSGIDTSPAARGVLNSLGEQGALPHEPVVEVVARLAREIKPEIVLSFGSLAAAYVFSARNRLVSPSVWIVSGMAADLLWPIDEPSLRAGPAQVLEEADGYIADCRRDEALVRRLGFSGVVALSPTGAGGPGADSLEPDAGAVPPSARMAILIDGRHDVRHRGLVAIAGLRLSADAVRHYRIVVHSAIDDVRVAAVVAGTDFQLDITTSSETPSMKVLLRANARARASVSLSLGEGVDPWSLAAMAAGSFPIQGAGQCLMDDVAAGQSTILVHPDEPLEVAAALHRVVSDDELVDRAGDRNRELAAPFVDANAAAERLIRMRRNILAVRG